MKSIKVVAAIILHDNQIFATQRGYGDFKGGWEFPGGKVEPGESPQEALRREIREELSMEIEVGELFETVEYDYPTFHLSMDCFLCKIKSGTQGFRTGSRSIDRKAAKSRINTCTGAGAAFDMP